MHSYIISWFIWERINNKTRNFKRVTFLNAIIGAIKAIAATVKELVAIIVAGGWGAVIIILVIILLAVVVGVVMGEV